MGESFQIDNEQDQFSAIQVRKHLRYKEISQYRSLIQAQRYELGEYK